MKFKKFIAAVISVAMIISCVNFTAFAEETSTEVTTAAAVKVNEDGYETLANALEKAKAMTGDVTVEINDKVTLNQNLNGSYSSIKFVGKTDSAEIYIDLQGYVEASGKNVAFENLKLSKSAAGYIYNAGFMNVAFGVYQASSVSYTDCTFANGAYASKGTNTFTKCTFYRSHDKYGLWAYGDVEVIVDNCTFADYRGIKMYAEGAAETVDLTVKNTNFSAVTDKPAIVLTYGESVTLEGNTYSPTGVFELDLGGAPNGTLVTSDVAPTCKNDNGACGVLVDGNIYTTVAQAAEVATKGSTVTLLHNSTETVKFAEGVTLDKNGFAAENVTATQTGLSGSGTEADPYLINNLAELKWFRDQVDLQSSDGTTQFTGKYFKLTNDINLIGENWNPIGSMSGDHGSFKGIFDGDGHTISNLYVETAGNGLGLFARTAGNAVIKNLTINNATLKSTNNSSYLGAVVANSSASTKIENVHVTGNLNIEGRGYLGGISGHGYVVMNNCSVKAEGTIKSSFWCVGGILGYGGKGATNITNSSVEGIGEGLILKSAAGGIGSIIGMAEDNNGTQPISGSNLSAKNVDIKTYEVGYGPSYAEYALGYLYGGNSTSKLTGTLEIEDVTFETSTGNTNPPVSDAVASINSKVYFSLADAVAAAEDGDTVTLISDVTVNATTIVDKDVTIDLNGKTISGISSESASYALITNKGDLTIKDSSAEQSGKITYKYTGASSNWSFAWGNYTIANRGTLTVDGGTIENTTNLTGHMYDAIDNYSGATATINGGTVSCPNYIAIRLFATSKTDDNSVTINGGTINGKFTIWPQNASSNSETPYKATLALNGGTITATEGGTALYISEFSDAFTITKADSVTLAEPEGYKWVNGKLTEDLLDTDTSFIRNISTTNTNGDPRYQVILFCGIDSLHYKEVGFEITVAGDTRTQGTDTVYKQYTAAGTTFSPDEWGDNCLYICGLKINFPTELKDESVTFRPYVENYDGTKVYGKYKTIDKIYDKVIKEAN